MSSNPGTDPQPPDPALQGTPANGRGGSATLGATETTLHERVAAESTSAALTAVKIVHTVVWMFFVACILAIPVVSWRGNHLAAAWLAAIVFLEVAILVINGWQCPLTSLASRYTEDRRHNFDIYLPEWLAKRNKLIFGTLFFLGVAFAGSQWYLAPR